MTDASRFSELLGVYHADSGLAGEARYILGKLFGTAHCALCDITHSPVRRKPAWDQMVARLGIPVTLLHLNELPSDVAAAVATTGTPVVLGVRPDGGLEPLLTPEQLEGMSGSVDEFEAALHQALAASGDA